MIKDKLLGKDLKELQEICSTLRLPKFSGKQIADWLYKKEISSIDEMSNLSKNARRLLNEKYEFGILAPLKVQLSLDGTKKYLFPTLHNMFIETAMIPDDDRKNSLRINSGRMQNGVSLLHDRETGFSRSTHSRRDC